MDVSVLIPTFGRPAHAAALAEGLARQSLPRERYEVLIGTDGEDPAGAEAAERGWARGGGRKGGLRVVSGPRAGQATVRNRLLPLASGSTLVFLNDDMVPDRALLERHLEAQLAATSHAPGGAGGSGQETAGSRGALVIGSCPWLVHQPDRLFDRLIRETSMVFFFDQMDAALADGRAGGTGAAGGAGPDHDWGFRHAWLLNLSAPAALVREVGGFTVFPATYGYEDDELAFRLSQRFGTRVLYRPGAMAHHDHRYEPLAYLEREYRLGYAALGFARQASECAVAMFRRDITAADEIEYARQFAARERRSAERLQGNFVNLAQLPAAAVSGANQREIIILIYQQHLMLKRWWWSRGLVDAADGRRMDPGL